MPQRIPTERLSGVHAVAHLSGTFAPVAWLVLPVLLEQTLALAVGITDKWLTGNLLFEAEYLAAIGLVGYIIGYLPGIFAIPSIAATALVARMIGATDEAGARRAAAQSLIVGVMVAMLAIVPSILFGSHLIRSLGLPEGSTALALEYLEIVLPALPAVMLIQVGVAILRGAGDMLAGFITMSVVNGVNAGASFVLATGMFGFPNLGWTGLAWGTLAGYYVGAILVILLLMRPSQPISPRTADWWPDWQWIRRILIIGVPAGFDAIGNACCHLWFLSIVNRLGNIDAAAHALAITIESMAYLPGYAFGVAAATLSGQFLGAHDERRARESVWMAAVGCVFLMTAVATVFYLSSDSLAAWFVGSTGHQDVAVLTAKLVRLVAFAQPPLAMLMVFSGALRGAGQTRVPMMVNFFGLLVVRLPLAMILAWPGVEIAGGVISLPGMNLGVVGAWLAMAADLTTRGLLMCAMFHWGTWSRVRV